MLQRPQEMLFTESEIAGFRNETPGCRNVMHFNNAGASLMPEPVREAIFGHVDLEAFIGGYEAAAARADEIAGFYSSAAKLLHAQPCEIAFTANATDAFSRAISSIPFKPGEVILTTNEDYISNQITYLAFQRRMGVRLIRARSLPSGGVDLNDFEDCLKRHKPRLVSVSHIPTNSGLIQPAAEIGSLCEKYQTLYLLDACQSVGQLDVDVRQLKCDFLSATSRKFLRGPRGAGFLYVSESVLDKGYEPLFIDMRGAEWVAPDRYIPKKDATRFEDWEFAYALLLGTKAAIDYAIGIDLNRIEKQIKYLSDHIRAGLQKIPGITVLDKGPALGGLITFHLQGSDPVFLKNELKKHTLNVETSLRDYAVIDFDEKQVGWAIRVSPHYFNNQEEVDSLIGAVDSLARQTKKPGNPDLPLAPIDKST